MEQALSCCIQDDAPSHAHHMVCTAGINFSQFNAKARSLIDTGASSQFVSSKFIHAHNIPTIACKPRTCRMADGSTVTIDRQALLNVRIGDHIDQALYYVTTLHNYDAVLGLLMARNP
jgi:hypothetical protein